MLAAVVRVGLMLAIRGYQWVLSPLKWTLFGEAARCRYTPSCSQYAFVAVQRFGPLPGARLAVARVCRCHPWGGHGFDPVPDRSGPREGCC